MKALVIFFILISCTVFSQDLGGHWNGSLHVQGKQIRIIFHVTKIHDQYEVTMDSPDQNASGIEVTTTNFDYPKVKFEIASLGAIYEGTMSNEAITGKWEQSGTSLFLVLSKSDGSTEK